MNEDAYSTTDPIALAAAARRAELFRLAFAPRRSSPADVAAGRRPMDIRHPLERDELVKLLKPATHHAD